MRLTDEQYLQNEEFDCTYIWDNFQFIGGHFQTLIMEMLSNPFQTPNKWKSAYFQTPIWKISLLSNLYYGLLPKIIYFQTPIMATFKPPLTRTYVRGGSD